MCHIILTKSAKEIFRSESPRSFSPTVRILQQKFLFISLGNVFHPFHVFPLIEHNNICILGVENGLVLLLNGILSFTPSGTYICMTFMK